MESESIEKKAAPASAGAATSERLPTSAPDAPTGGEEDQAHLDAKLRPEREAAFGDYLRIFSYAQKWDFVLLVAAVLASGGSGVTLPLMNVVFGALVGDFSGYFLPVPTQTEAQFRASFNRNALYIFILFLGRFILTYINKFCYRLIGIRMSAAIRLDYLRCLFGQTIHVLDSMPPGAAAGTITATANTLQLGISEKLGVFVEFVVTIIAATVIAFVYSWSLALVTCSVLLFTVLTVSIIIPFYVKGTTRVTRAEAKSSSVASEAFSAIRMVTACGAESQISKRFNVWVESARRHGQRTSPLIALQFGLIFFAFNGAFGLAFWFGAKSFLDGTLNGNVGTIVVVLMSVMMMVISLERISTPLIAVGKATVAACEFFTVIDAPRPETGELKEPEVSATSDIIFKGVDFAYPSRPHVKVLDQLDLRIETGKITAIVGPSGSGKSTIVGLVERWYTLHDQYIIAKAIEKDVAKEKNAKKKGKGKKKDGDSDDEKPVPDLEETGPPVELKGSISTCGHELNEIDLNWWRSQIGLVQQEPFLFNDTVYNNVAHGLVGSAFENESEERKRELVKEACKEAFADEFIDRLPDGYETLVGDSGTKLSGGQRQRLCIARAVIKRPKILILDEATSAIDVRGERIVQAALDKVSQGRTTITIAHRLSTIKKADTIVVLKKGRVVEQGTHESLLRDEAGIYYGLVHAQQLSLGESGDDDSDGHEEEDLGSGLDHKKSAALSDTANLPQSAGWENKGLFGSFGRLLHEQRSRFPLYAITIASAMASAASTPLQAFLFSKIIVVFLFVDDPPRFTSEANFWSLMWLVLAICTGFAYFVLGFASNHLAHFISATYRQQYFEGMLHQRIAFFDNEENSPGSLTARVGGDPKQLEELLGMNMAMAYNALFTVIGALIIAFIFGWKLALVAMCVTMPLGLLAGYLRLQYELEFEAMNAAVFAESSKFAAESISAFRTVASLTLEGAIGARYAALLQGHVASAGRKARLRTLVFAFSESIGLGCQALIFWYGGILLATREYDAYRFFLCYMAVIQGAESAGQGFAFGPNAAQAAAAANRILSIRESREKGRRQDGAAPDRIPDTEGGVRIELRDVHFRYPTRDVPIFRGLSLTIEKGQFAALVGASGCGKTSIVSLLERFYDVQRGQILANGRDIATLDVRDYRRHLSLVAQEPNLFSGTLRENILLGAAVSDDALHAACRDASIHDFVASLPDGYDTEVGSRGVSLSGGQKQRVAIARALVRRPDVLLLDEATSSLDSESERLVQRAFERAARGRTMVVVAHRLATVQNADVIFVLGEGRVLEKGSHAELLRRKGVYWNMCQSQALDR
ncbi:P-loop containing nucleoside triphosphate hydrolase protein [Durotheca rogersii]|uniref:P-loop containing nucleoside triphosphate hydrolase protein n=1 Tax=Durotheca rogersii TaxID=419775 RepID=UPI002220F3AB|nr:P-loop containing nucleoside triphosphate hydrolase protein [Durotheca rogersii]KAI5867037.1 P-loop containing nucleoside triphosphate hydrolase protein [Durotheca rogersii]